MKFKKQYIFPIIIIFLILVNIISVSAENYVPELIEGNYIYDLANLSTKSTKTHINSLSQKLYEQANINLYILTTDTLESYEDYIDQLSNDWDFQSDNNLIVVFEKTDKKIINHIFKSNRFDYNISNTIKTYPTVYGYPLFVKEKYDNGILYSYNSIFKTIGLYYDIEIDGVNMEKLKTEPSKTMYYVIAIVLIIFVGLVFVSRPAHTKRAEFLSKHRNFFDR